MVDVVLLIVYLIRYGVVAAMHAAVAAAVALASVAKKSYGRREGANVPRYPDQITKSVELSAATS